MVRRIVIGTVDGVEKSLALVPLKKLADANPDPKVFINGDTKAEFGTAITVLDEARKLGITKVAIETQPRTAP